MGLGLGPLYTNRPRIRDARFCGDVDARPPRPRGSIKRNMHAYAEHAAAASVRAYATPSAAPGAAAPGRPPRRRRPRLRCLRSSRRLLTPLPSMRGGA